MEDPTWPHDWMVSNVMIWLAIWRGEQLACADRIAIKESDELASIISRWMYDWSPIETYMRHCKLAHLIGGKIIRRLIKF